MKSFFLIAILSLIGFASFAQSDSRYKAVNVAEEKVTTFTTADSVTTTAQTIIIDSNAVGIIELVALGYATSNGDGITCKKIVRYKKELGILTLGTTSDILATEADSGLSGAAVSFVASSNNILIKVKGKLATTVTWRLIVKRRTVLKVSS